MIAQSPYCCFQGANLLWPEMPSIGKSLGDFASNNLISWLKEKMWSMVSWELLLQRGQGWCSLKLSLSTLPSMVDNLLCRSFQHKSYILEIGKTFHRICPAIPTGIFKGTDLLLKEKISCLTHLMCLPNLIYYHN